MLLKSITCITYRNLLLFFEIEKKTNLNFKEILEIPKFK